MWMSEESHLVTTPRDCVMEVQTALADGGKPQSGLALADQICKAVSFYILCCFSGWQSPRSLTATRIILVQPFPIEDTKSWQGKWLVQCHILVAGQRLKLTAGSFCCSFHYIILPPLPFPRATIYTFHFVFLSYRPLLVLLRSVFLCLVQCFVHNRPLSDVSE